MPLRNKILRSQLNLFILFFLLLFIKPFGVSAQEGIVDSLYLDSLYDVIFESIYIKKDYQRSEDAIGEGIDKSIEGSYNFYKFSYFNALVMVSKKEIEPALLLFNSIIKDGSSSSNPKFRYLAGLSHSDIARIHLTQEDKESMDDQLNKAIALFSFTDFQERNNIYNIEFQYCFNQGGKSCIPLLIKKLINNIKEYIYTHSNFSTINKKNNMYRNMSSTYSNIAYEYEYNNDFVNAKVFYQLAVYFESKSSNVNPNDKITDQYNLAYINFYLKDYKASELLTKDIISSNAKLDIPDAEIESGCLKLLGDIRIEKKDYIDALKYYEKAMEIADSIYADGNSDIQYFHEGLAKIHYELKDYKQSIQQYKKALKATKNDTGKNKLNYLIGLAECYSFSNKRQALEYFNEALKIVEYVSDIQRTEAIARINYKIGSLETDKAKAYPYHELARKFSSESLYPIEDASKNLIRMAQFNLNNETIFLELMKEAITANLSKGSQYNLNEIPKNEDIIFPMLLLKCYHYLGDYFTDKDEEKSLNYYLMAKKLIAIIKPMYRYENSKSALIRESIPVYDKIITLSAERYKTSHDIKYFEWAFDAVEKSKSIRLNDIINDYKAIGSAGIPDSLFEYGQQIKTQIAYHKERLNISEQNLSEQQIKDINNILVELNTKYDDYIVGIENDFPEYYELKYSITPIDIHKIQATINEQDLVLNYHIQDSFLITLVISKKTFSLEKENIKQKEIEEYVGNLMKGLCARNKNDLKEKTQQLYDILLRKTLKKNNDIKHLIITPDGVLNYLSFEILAENNHNNSQVIYSKSIVYNYSSAQSYLNKNTIRKRQKLLGIAPLYNSVKFDRLPHAKKEIEKIHEKWGGTTLENEQANLENFKTVVNKHTIVHIAGHAEINSDFPLQSRLVFSESGDIPYSLYAHELYNMKLDLDMVSLSACNSGIGLLKQGEGAMSLARGFAYAGCPSTVMTLWPMTDKPTMDIMVQYYSYLRQGLSKSEALRSAKLNYIKNCGPKAEDPYFWAGIVIIGSDSPLFHVPFYRQLWFQILLSAILLLVLITMIKRFKK
ncbi:MAG: CHAT domain-containing protein [Maribacter sp.]|jgi:CHAT domain-containing protein